MFVVQFEFKFFEFEFKLNSFEGFCKRKKKENPKPLPHPISFQPKPISFADLTLAFNLLASTVAYALRKLSASPSHLRLIMNRSLDHRFAHRFAVLDLF